MARTLLGLLHLDPRDLYRVNGPVNLHRLAAIYGHADRPDLKYRPFLPGTTKRLDHATNLFESLRKHDVLLHHPFESFAPVLDLLHQAAEDSAVLAIKQTLYRTDPKSAVVEALIEAARAGKEVTVVIELRARFDAAANIKLAHRLQEAGANVVYGVVGFKSHAKLLLIVRREGRSLRRYAHLGTGNYHARTARQYTDIGLLTANRELCEDVHAIFMQLTGPGAAPQLVKTLQSPFTLYGGITDLIAAETKNARAGKPARIIAKMNSLSAPGVIEALYGASQAGVQIDLIVRGLCCLRPGVKGVSENIRVRSIIGRFLEHSRIFYFLAGGRERLYCSSADWMQRNLFRRVEACFPIEDPELVTRLKSEGLEVYLEESQGVWSLQRDGSYSRQEKPSGAPAQELLLSSLAEARGPRSTAKAKDKASRRTRKRRRK
jgi:polyphosphate kinase